MNAFQGVKEKLRSPPAAHKHRARFHHPRGIHIVHEKHEHEKNNADKIKKLYQKTHKHNAHATQHPIDHRHTTVSLPNDKDKQILKTLGQILPKYKEKNETTPTPAQTAPHVTVTVAKLPPDPAKVAAAKIADAAQEKTVGAISRLLERKHNSQYIGHPAIERQIEKEENYEAKMAEKRIQLEEARQQLLKEREAQQQETDHHEEHVVKHDQPQHFEGEQLAEPIPHHQANANHVKPELHVTHQEAPKHPIQNPTELMHHDDVQQEQVHPEQIHIDPAHNDPSHPVQANHEPVHVDPVHPEPVHPDPVHHEPVHPEAVHPDTVHHEPIHPDPVHPNLVHHEPIRPDAEHHEPIHPEPTRHENGQLHPDQAQHKPVHHEADHHNLENPTMIAFHHEAEHPVGDKHQDELRHVEQHDVPEHHDNPEHHETPEHHDLPEHHENLDHHLDNGHDDQAAFIDHRLNVHPDRVNDLIDHSDLDHGRFTDFHGEPLHEQPAGAYDMHNFYDDDIQDHVDHDYFDTYGYRTEL